MMEDLYKKYLKAYIEKLTIDKDIYYISICDIEYEIIELLHDFEIEGIKIAIVNKFDYSTAVKYRNDRTVSRIVILIPDSVKKIDSLKDFNEYSIFPEVEEDSAFFWDIIKNVFFLKKGPLSKEIKFINLIIKEKRITLSQFFELIENSVENNEISIKKLNENLNLVNCWKSNGEFGTNLKSLRKLIRLSDPTEIEKRISTMSTETIENKELKDFTLISKLSFENKYTDLFKKFYFEKLPEKFTIKPIIIKNNKNKNNDIDDNESTKQYKFSYEAYMEESEAISIDKFEDEMKNNMKEQFAQSIEKFETELDKKSISMDTIKIKIDSIINDVNTGINIDYIAQERLIKKIEDFKNATIEIYKDIKENKVYPHILNKFCIRTKKFLESYISLLSFIATDEKVLDGLGENKIIQDLQNLFITPSENKRIMSFMHPIAIFYFNCINDKFKEILSYYEEYDNNNSIQILLDGILNADRAHFPINIITDNNKLYIINKDFQNVFAYYEFREKTQMSSESLLDIRTISNSIGKYLAEFPYKSEVVVSIIGNPSLKNIGSLKKIIDSVLRDNISIIQKFRIDIISESHKIISKEIDELYINESLENRIQFRLLNVELNKSGNYDTRALLNNTINESDIVLLLDCYVLYKKEEIRRIANGYNFNLNEILATGRNHNLGDQAINLNFPIEILWTTLHNMFLHKNNSLSTWTINELDNAIVNLIKPEIENNSELMICMITSNLNIIKKIYMKNNFSSSIIRSKGKEFLELTFGSYIKNIHLNDNENEYEFSCECSLKCILESILDDEEIEEFVKDMQYEPKEILENLVIRFKYDNKNSRFEIICYYPEDENESFRIEEYKNTCEFILKYAFCNLESYSSLLKGIIVNYLYSSIKNYGDALLVNYIERYFKFDKDTALSYDTQPDNYKISWDTNTTNIRNMISYIETNSIDERFKTDFKYAYDIDELKKIHKQAHMMNILDNKLLKKIDFILKGEQ